MCGLNIAHMRKIGIDKLAENATLRSSILYNYIDASDYYSNAVDVKFRSKMNVPFRIQKGSDPALEDRFIEEARQAGFLDMRPNLSAIIGPSGGVRASMYNAMSVEGVRALVAFMKKFKAANK